MSRARKRIHYLPVEISAGPSTGLPSARVALTEKDLDELAELLKPRIFKLSDATAARWAEAFGPRQQGPTFTSRWLNAKEAAEYLGITVASLHKKTAAREIPFEQEIVGGKLWFKVQDLDEWRRGKK